MPILLSPARERAGYRVAAVGAFGVLGVALSLTYRFTGFGFPCPWRILTGTLCPFCGATRMGTDLLAADFPAAWSHNAFVLTGGIGLAVATIFWIVQALGGPAFRLPGILRDSRLWWGAFAVAGVAFAVVRNL